MTKVNLWFNENIDHFPESVRSMPLPPAGVMNTREPPTDAVFGDWKFCGKVFIDFPNDTTDIPTLVLPYSTVNSIPLSVLSKATTMAYPQHKLILHHDTESVPMTGFALVYFTEQSYQEDWDSLNKFFKKTTIAELDKVMSPSHSYSKSSSSSSSESDDDEHNNDIFSADSIISGSFPHLEHQSTEITNLLNPNDSPDNKEALWINAILQALHLDPISLDCVPTLFNSIILRKPFELIHPIDKQPVSKTLDSKQISPLLEISYAIPSLFYMLYFLEIVYRKRLRSIVLKKPFEMEFEPVPEEFHHLYDFEDEDEDEDHTIPLESLSDPHTPVAKSATPSLSPSQLLLEKLVQLRPELMKVSKTMSFSKLCHSISMISQLLVYLHTLADEHLVSLLLFPSLQTIFLTALEYFPPWRPNINDWRTEHSQRPRHRLLWRNQTKEYIENHLPFPPSDFDPLFADHIVSSQQIFYLIHNFFKPFSQPLSVLETHLGKYVPNLNIQLFDTENLSPVDSLDSFFSKFIPIRGPLSKFLLPNGVLDSISEILVVNHLQSAGYLSDSEIFFERLGLCLRGEYDEEMLKNAPPSESESNSSSRDSSTALSKTSLSSKNVTKNSLNTPFDEKKQLIAVTYLQDICQVALEWDNPHSISKCLIFFRKLISQHNLLDLLLPCLKSPNKNIRQAAVNILEFALFRDSTAARRKIIETYSVRKDLEFLEILLQMILPNSPRYETDIGLLHSVSQLFWLLIDTDGSIEPGSSGGLPLPSGISGGNHSRALQLGTYDSDLRAENETLDFLNLFYNNLFTPFLDLLLGFVNDIESANSNFQVENIVLPTPIDHDSHPYLSRLSFNDESQIETREKHWPPVIRKSISLGKWQNIEELIYQVSALLIFFLQHRPIETTNQCINNHFLVAFMGLLHQVVQIGTKMMIIKLLRAFISIAPIYYRKQIESLAIESGELSDSGHAADSSTSSSSSLHFQTAEIINNPSSSQVSFSKSQQSPNKKRKITPLITKSPKISTDKSINQTDNSIPTQPEKIYQYLTTSNLLPFLFSEYASVFHTDTAYSNAIQNVFVALYDICISPLPDFDPISIAPSSLTGQLAFSKNSTIPKHQPLILAQFSPSRLASEAAKTASVRQKRNSDTLESMDGNCSKSKKIVHPGYPLGIFVLTKLCPMFYGEKFFNQLIVQQYGDSSSNQEDPPTRNSILSKHLYLIHSKNLQVPGFPSIEQESLAHSIDLVNIKSNIIVLDKFVGMIIDSLDTEDIIQILDQEGVNYKPSLKDIDSSTSSSTLSTILSIDPQQLIRKASDFMGDLGGPSPSISRSPLKKKRPNNQAV